MTHEKNRWNNSDFLPSSTGPVKFCNDFPYNPDCQYEHTLSRALKTTIEKYISFSLDPRHLKNLTKHEQYIIDNYATELPKLMYKVDLFMK